MTAQAPDHLVVECPYVALDGLDLYGVIRGDPRKSDHGWGDGDAVATKPTHPPNVSICSALWRGCIAYFVLQEDGRLRLSRYEHLLKNDQWHKQEVDEMLVGDFWLVMKKEFFGTRTYVPFQAGVVVEDQGQWFNEAPD